MADILKGTGPQDMPGLQGGSSLSGSDKEIKTARSLAKRFHRGQVRRESGLSFFEAHLEPVAQMVYDHGGDSLVVAAALLHDAIEDGPDYAREYIEDFSKEVLAIVDEVTEVGDTWQERKQNYIASVSGMSWRALLISLCDKLVTGRDFCHEWEAGQFGKRPESILWFYDTILPAYEARNREVGHDSWKSLLWDLHAAIGRMHEVWQSR